MADRACRHAYIDGFVGVGERVIVVAGVPFGTPGATNNLRIAKVGPDGGAAERRFARRGLNEAASRADEPAPRAAAPRLDLEDRRDDAFGRAVVRRVADAGEPCQRRAGNVARAADRMNVGVDDAVAIAGDDRGRRADRAVARRKRRHVPRRRPRPRRWP